MPKDKSKKPAKAKEALAVAASDIPKKASVPRGVKKHLRELESQLADAARKEHKRMQKLERAAQRRQSIGSALDKLRIQTAGPAVTAAPATVAPAATPHKAPTARTASPRPPSTRRPAAGATRTARKAHPASGPAASPADSSEPAD
jgi:hypothetical protein